MIQRFPTHFGRFDKDPQVLDELRLAGKFVDRSRANIVLKLFVQGSQSAFIGIEIEIGHEQIYRLPSFGSPEGSFVRKLAEKRRRGARFPNFFCCIYNRLLKLFSVQTKTDAS